MTGLAVIIVSWNVRTLLEECLASVYASLLPLGGQHEVIVVDNASSDGSCQMVRNRFSQVTLLENDTNVGFAAANNQALTLARGTYLLLLNPDTLMRPDAVSDMIDVLERMPKVGMVGPRLVYGDGSFQHSAFGFPNLAQVFLDLFPMNHRLTESRLNGRYPRSWYAGLTPFPVGHPLGACMLVRREAIAAIGPMDEGFFMYCEEVDWALRIHRAGWSIYCVPSAEVVHFGGQSTRQFRDEMFVALWRSRFRLFEKHYGPAFRACARAIVRLGLRRSARIARREMASGRLTRQELDLRLAAFHRVSELTHSIQGSA